MKRLLWLPVMIVLVCPLVLRAGENDKIRTETDLVFGKGGAKDLKLDLFMPENGKGPFPAVVCVHGGSWRGGSYKAVYASEVAKLLARNGYVAVSVQYRLVPDATFPSQLEDCKCSVRWLRANADKYKIDRDRIGAVGFSAGGHLACLLGLTTKEDGMEGDGGCSAESSQVQAVVDFFGPSDLRKGDRPGSTTLKDFLGCTLLEKPEAYSKASPITYVRKSKTLPPFLMLHGTEDRLVGYDQSVRLADAIKAAGGQAKLVTMEGLGHGLWPPPQLEQARQEVVRFFDEQLKKK